MGDILYQATLYQATLFRFTLTSGSLITNRSPGFNSDTSIKDEMHCVAMVLDATKLPKHGSDKHNRLLELKEQIVARGKL